MLADETYLIKAEIVVEDHSEPGIKPVHRRLATVEDRTRRVGLGLSKLGGLLAGLGAGAAGRGVIRLHSEMQNFTGSIATSFSVFQNMDPSSAMAAARGEIGKLSKDAAEGVGGLDDYVTAYTRLVSLNTGMNSDALRAMTRQSLVAGFALRGSRGVKEAPLDIAQALEQGVNDKITPIASKVVQAAGETAEAFNKMGKAARLDVLRKGFEKFEPMAKEMGKTWDAQAETFKDQLKSITRRLTTPLFERWSEQLSKANGWLEKNGDNIQNIIDRWAPKLVSVWDHLINKAGTYAAIVAGAHLAQGLPVMGGRKATPGAPGFMANFRGGGVRGALFGQAKSRDGAGKFTAATAGLLGKGGAAAALKGMLSGLLRVAGPIAIITTLLLGVQGALQEFPEVLIWLQGEAAGLMAAFGELGLAFGALTGQGSALNLVGAGLIFVIGGVLRLLTLFVKGIAILVEGIGIALNYIGTAAKQLMPVLRMMAALVSGDFAAGRAAAEDYRRVTDQGQAGRDAAWKRLNDLVNSAPDPTKALKEGEDGAPSGMAGAPAQNVTNYNVQKVEVSAERLDDPARVALTFEDLATKLNRSRRQARGRAGAIPR